MTVSRETTVAEADDSDDAGVVQLATTYAALSRTASPS